MSEKVDTERLIHEGILDGQKAESCQNGDSEVNQSADWEPVKPVHEVLNRST